MFRNCNNITYLSFCLLLVALLIMGMETGGTLVATNELKIENKRDFTPYNDSQLNEFFGVRPYQTELISDTKTSFPEMKSGFSEKIIGIGQLTPERMVSYMWWFNKSLPLDKIKSLVDLYVTEAKIEGVNHDVAFCQMCLETGFLRFNGDVDKSQFNFCGLGATGNGEKGLSFETMEDGVRAHIQHLKVYASEESLCQPSISGRVRFVNRGQAVDIHGLTGTWAADLLYGTKLNMMLERAFSADYIFSN